MVMPSKLVVLEFSDKSTMLAEIDEIEGTETDVTPQLAGSKPTVDFAIISKTIQNVAKEVHDALDKVAPDSTEVEFGLDLSGSTGALTTLLVKGDAKASLKIKMRWEKPQKDK